MEDDGVFVVVEKVGRSSRRFRCKVTIAASLDEVWKVMTDFERLSEFLPGVSASKILERRENFTRVCQVGRQDVAFGLKVNSKGTMEYYERDIEVFDSGKRRSLDFKMVEGELQVYEGKWTLEQLNEGIAEDECSKPNEGCETTVSYLLDVKPKLWLPIQLVEGKLSKLLLETHKCIRGEVMRLIQTSQPSR